MAKTAIQEQLEEQALKISEMEKKVFNGFGSDIKNIRESVDKLDERNETHHLKIRDEIHAVRNLVIKMLIAVVAGMVINIVIQAGLNIRSMSEKEIVKTEDVRIAE